MLKSVASRSEELLVALGCKSDFRTRLILTGLLVATAYYLGALLSFNFRMPSTRSSILWAPNAILLAVFLVTPIHRWWWWVLAVLPAHLLAQARDGAPVLVLLCPFFANVAQAGIAALTLRRFNSQPWRLNTLRNMVVFIVVAVIVVPAIVSYSSAWLFVLAGWETEYRLVAEARFLSNVITGLTVAPLVLAIAGGEVAPLSRVGARRWLEFGLILFALVAALGAISRRPIVPSSDFPIELYAPLPFLIWAAVRSGPAGLSVTLLVVAAHSIMQTINSKGAFSEGTPAQNLLSLEVSLAMLSLPLMLLAALTQEGREKTKVLEESEARFRTTADTAPVMIWMSGSDKLCTFFSKGWLDFTGRTIEQELGNGWSAGVHPSDFQDCLQTYVESFDRRHEFSMEFRLRRADGEYRWILDKGAPRYSRDGEFLGFIGSAIDISERKRSEAWLITQYEITRILSESDSLAVAAPRVLQTICQALDWQCGELWRMDPAGDVLEFAESWHQPSKELAEFLLASQPYTFASGVGIPGRTWRECKPQWISDLAEDRDFHRVELAAKAQLRSAISFPVHLEDRLLCVMVFFGAEIRDADQEMLEVIGNISILMGQFAQRKETEQALRESEDRLARTEKVSLVMVTHSALDGRWLKVPPKLCELLGYTEEELLGRCYYDVTHPLDVEANRSARQRLIRGEIQSFDLEKRYLRKDGSIVWVYINGSLVTGAAGEPIHLLSYIRDISQRKSAEEALRESEARLQLAMDAARIGYWELEVDTGKLSRSPSLERILGFSPGSVDTRESFKAFIHAEDRGIASRHLERCLESTDPVDSEFRIVRPDGIVRWIASRGQMIPGPDGEPSRVLGLTADITERKYAELEVHRLRERLEAENKYLRAEVSGAHRHGEILGESKKIGKILEQIEQVAGTDMTVLVLGETGTGKELVARAVHDKSSRRDRPLVKVNCSTLPGGLIESELFGHERGAFTGASSRQAGRFELADRGTIFLDEVGELPLGLQTKLLRVLQEGEFERLGSGKTIKVDVRIIAATNRNLTEAMRQGRFRSDLYYRLNVYPIHIPPLRERKEDIGLLAMRFLTEINLRLGRWYRDLPPNVLEALRHYDWPGNIRELENVIERAALTSTGETLQLPEGWEMENLSPKQNSEPSSNGSVTPEVAGANTGSKATLKAMERARILEVLRQTRWRIEGSKGAALILGLHPNTLRSRMQKLGIEKPAKTVDAS